jgi:hypothetical protein
MGSVPPASRGNLKEGVVNCACFYELWSCDWYKASSLQLPRRLPDSKQARQQRLYLR